MKLRNKKTGEIKNVNHSHVLIHFNDGETKSFNCLAKLNEEWEDYEEPKESYYIDCDGEIYEPVRLSESDLNNMTSIGNYFKTREEAERAVEKLKAWKRLKDKGFEFKGYTGWDYGENVDIQTNLTTDDLRSQQEAIIKDLDLLFGGGE